MRELLLPYGRLTIIIYRSPVSEAYSQRRVFITVLPYFPAVLLILDRARFRSKTALRLRSTQEERLLLQGVPCRVQAQEIITEELIEILRKFLPDIRELASTNDKFKVVIPNDYELHGTVLFFMVINIEEGFRVPESELKIIHTLYEVNQWRE